MAKGIKFLTSGVACVVAVRPPMRVPLDPLMALWVGDNG